jgi:(S)-ureidoglycine aminohydrolase
VVAGVPARLSPWFARKDRPGTLRFALPTGWIFCLVAVNGFEPMNFPFGQTRTRVARRHALIAPDGHVKSSVPGISGATVVILINEAMGARFAQLLVTFAAGGTAEEAGNECETAGYVETGGATITIEAQHRKCVAGGFFFAPAGKAWTITAPKAGTRVTLFQKRFVPLSGVAAPPAIIGDATKIKGQPFLGDPDARLQVLLPDEPAFDLAMNVFTYQPGATLPFVETHVMEHGLLMLAGQGVYRLEDSWYPVTAGDAIWMAPYCPQWFVAMGRTPAKYLYFKDVNRSAL